MGFIRLPWHKNTLRIPALKESKQAEHFLKSEQRGWGAGLGNTEPLPLPLYNMLLISCQTVQIKGLRLHDQQSLPFFQGDNHFHF